MNIVRHAAAKRIYVSAASGGLGFETAARFAEEGAQVAISARGQSGLDSAKERILLRAPGASVLTIAADISQRDGQELVLRRLTDDDHLPDVFVCGAGHPPQATLEALDRQAWTKGVEMILGHATFACRQFLPEMVRRGGGHVFFVSSIHAKVPYILPSQFLISSVARAGLLALAKAVTQQYGPSGIVTVTFMLGFIDTLHLRETAAALSGLENVSREEAYRPQFDAWASSIPSRRIASPAEVAELVLFMTRPEASYLNGSVLPFTGGSTGQFCSHSITGR